MSHQQEVGKRKIPNLLDKRKDIYSKPTIIRPSENFTCFGVTKTKAGDAEISLALKIIMEDGKQYIIQYHEINSPMKYDGATTIKLNTPSVTITITGKRMDDIIDYLAEHRLVWIKEPDSDFTQTEENEPEIEKIIIEEKYLKVLGD